MALIANLSLNILRKTVFAKCSAEEWVTIGLFLVLMIVCVSFATKTVAKEQGMK